MKIHRVLVGIGGILFVYNLLVYSIVFASNPNNFPVELPNVEAGLGVGFVLLLIANAMRANQV